MLASLRCFLTIGFSCLVVFYPESAPGLSLKRGWYVSTVEMDLTLLSDTFSYVTFGNGLVAVLAGLIANGTAGAFGFVAPFVLAILPLATVALVVSAHGLRTTGTSH